MATALKDAVEIIPRRLFYVTLASGPAEDAIISGKHFWSVDEYTYWNYFLDWGPLSLASLYRFCRKLNSKLNLNKLREKIIYVYSGTHAYKRTNAAFLLSSWALLYRGKSPTEAFSPFWDLYPSFPPFRDASPCICLYDLTIPHCLEGLHKAYKCGFFDFHKFDVDEYDFFEKVENGDVSWIIDGKILAFAGPRSLSGQMNRGYRTIPPNYYIPYFKKWNVTLVVRLNKKCYDERVFLDAGIQYLDASFPDGETPPEKILDLFLAACERTTGAIAVHCKAGLGRTGTCIGCYIMKHYGFSAAEAIGWMRICRSGSVLGQQQHFLEAIENHMHREGYALRPDAATVRQSVQSSELKISKVGYLYKKQENPGDVLNAPAAVPATPAGGKTHRRLDKDTSLGPDRADMAATGFESGQAVTENVLEPNACSGGSRPHVPMGAAAATATRLKRMSFASNTKKGRVHGVFHQTDTHHSLAHREVRQSSTCGIPGRSGNGAPRPSQGQLQQPQRMGPAMEELSRDLERLGMRRGSSLSTAIAASAGGAPGAATAGGSCLSARRASAPSSWGTGGNTKHRGSNAKYIRSSWDKSVRRPRGGSRAAAEEALAAVTATSAASVRTPRQQQRQHNDDCATVSLQNDRRTVDVWQQALAGREEFGTTQGDLLRQQRARNVARGTALKGLHQEADVLSGDRYRK